MNLSGVDEVIESAIKDGAFPGAAYGVFHKGTLETAALGRQTYCPESQPVDENSIWDLASLTKVVATTTVAMLLHEDGKLDLDQPVCEVIPEFGQNGKQDVVFRNLLLHDAGLIPDLLNIERFFDAQSTMDAVFFEPLHYPTGSKMVYSDLSMIVLAEAMRRLGGAPLDSQASKRIFEPHGMVHTRFSPVGLDRANGETKPDQTARCVPTETVDSWRKALRDRRFTPAEQTRLFGQDLTYIQAEVHDPTSAVLEGVAGHAGLFSTVVDLAKFMTALTGGKIAKTKTVHRWTKQHSNLSSRALGWDTKSIPSSAGELFSDHSFGHTGYTGTSIWCDPENELFAILLTNRVHPTAKNLKISQVRPAFHDAVFTACCL